MFAIVPAWQFTQWIVYDNAYKFKMVNDSIHKHCNIAMNVVAVVCDVYGTFQTFFVVFQYF